MRCLALRLQQRDMTRHFFVWACLLICCDSIVFAQPFFDRKPVSWSYRDSSRRNLIVSASDIKTAIVQPISLDSILAKERELNRKDVENAQKRIPVSRPQQFLVWYDLCNYGDLLY